MTTSVYGTLVTPYLTGRIAAWLAASPPASPDIDFAGGLLVVGDGGGVPRTPEAILANGGVFNQVWSGATIQGAALDPGKPNQVNVHCLIPSANQGGEIGPFIVREFAIYVEDDDEQLQLAVVGSTYLEKTTGAQNGQTSDLTWIAAISVSSAQPIIMTDPSSFFATGADIRNFFNSKRPTAEAPVLIEETTDQGGWIRQLFKMRRATQPSAPAPGQSFADAASIGSGRPASAAEFAAKAPNSGAGNFQWPWVTLQQFWAVIDGLVIPARPGAVAPITYNAETNNYGFAAATPNQVRAGESTATGVTPSALAASQDFLVLANAATIAWNYKQGYNAEITLTGNRTMGAMANAHPGASGILQVRQDATGGRELAWHSSWDWGAAGPPVLSTAPNRIDVVSYVVLSVSPLRIRATFSQG